MGIITYRYPLAGKELITMATGKRDAHSVIQVSELHRTPGRVLRRVAVEKQRLVIERGGYPVAVLIPFDEYETEAERALEALAAEVRPRVKAAGLTEEQVVDDLRAIRKRRHEAGRGKAKR
jgi:prevent-host-death family protein